MMTSGYNPKKYLKEQSEISVTLSDDPKERIVNYLDNEKLVEKIAEIAADLDDNEFHQLEIQSTEYGILEGDTLFLQSLSEDKKHPKFALWVMNDDIMYEDTDFDAAATVLKNAAKGMGTDELTIVSIAGAIGRMANEKKVDPYLLFKKLNDVFKSKYGESLTDLIEEEFSGRAEATGLNVFRRKIAPSIARGITDNILNITADVALLFFTFGGGTIASSVAKGGARATVETVKHVGKGVRAAEATTKASEAMGGLKKIWKGFSSIKKLKTFKNSIPVGSEIKYISKEGTVIKGTVQKYRMAGNVGKVVIKSDKKTFATSLDNLVANVGKEGGITKDTFKQLKFAGAFATKKMSEIASGEDIKPGGDGINIAEILGYYDTLAADPESYIESAKEMDAKALASQIFDLKEGTGLWGNTTDQEELALALIITSLTPEACRLVANRYKKLDPHSSVYEVLDDELSGDMAMFTKAWWTGCTGEGTEYEDDIESALITLKK